MHPTRVRRRPLFTLEAGPGLLMPSLYETPSEIRIGNRPFSETMEPASGTSSLPVSPLPSRPPAAIDPGGGLDLIGDIHGHVESARRVLDRLGYVEREGVFEHADRTAVFLGDYIDRGPAIRETLEMVRRMVDAGTGIALMGNHEYNAIAWFTPRPDRPELPCRRHTPIRRRLFSKTLDSLGDESETWIEWMSRLPLWMESDRIRAAHAGWDRSSVDLLDELVSKGDGRLADATMQATCAPGTRAFQAIETMLKGHEVPLPEELVLQDPEGSPRRHIRGKWYESPRGHTYRSYAMTMDDGFPDVPIMSSAIADDFTPYGRQEPPIFVGHYWMQGGVPTRLAENVACLDWSIARGGPLVAYRFDGEREIDDSKFVAVD